MKGFWGSFGCYFLFGVLKLFKVEGVFEIYWILGGFDML